MATHDFREAHQAEFGAEAIFNRLPLSHLGCFGTQICATIVPEHTQEDTLRSAWELVQRLARWLLARSVRFPIEERYMVIVAWSASVRPLQGHIFKVGGTTSDLQQITDCECFEHYQHRSGRTALIPRWQKDVFQ